MHDGAARLHASGEFGLGHAGVLHGTLDLPGQHALDGARGGLVQAAVLDEEVLEVAADVAVSFLAGYRSRGRAYSAGCQGAIAPRTAPIRPT